MKNFSVSLDGPIARVVLTRPEQGNRLDIVTMKALSEALAGVGRAAEIKVVHLRGEGENFCLGRQLPPVEPGVEPPRKTAIETREQLIDPILALYATIRNLPIPIVATVTGAAHGVGCALAVACDVTIAVETARFSLPELRSKIPPTLAMSALLHAVSPKALAHLVYSTEEISAPEALRLGLVSMTVPVADFDVVIDRYLENMASSTRPALAAVKEYLNLAPHQDPHGAVRYAANLLSTVLASQ